MTETLSLERRTAVLTRLRRPSISRLSEEAALLYAVGLLVSGDTGKVDQAAVAAAYEDQDTLRVARELLRRARA